MNLFAYLLEMWDLLWIELIMVEQPVARFVGNSELQPQLDQCTRAIHKLKLLSTRISHALAYMQHEATKKGGESLGADRLGKFALNCHTRYNESHPVTLIHWYLNGEKISVYFDVFLGPTESKAVSPSQRRSMSFLKVHICRIREHFWPSNLSIYLLYLSTYLSAAFYAAMPLWSSSSQSPPLLSIYMLYLL